MCAHQLEKKPGLISSMLQNKCPRCRQGKLFKQNNPYRLKTFMQMNQHCPVCGQPLDMEPGFYYGTSYVSYALAIMISVASFIAWWLIIGFSLEDKRFFAWLAFNALLLIGLQPVLMRISRSIWLAFFVRYSADWRKGDIVQPERINKDQMNNW